MASYTFVKSKSGVTINGTLDESPETYMVTTDGEKRVLVKSENRKSFEILITDTVTINGTVFSGTLAQLRQSLEDNIFTPQGLNTADSYANDTAAGVGGIPVGGLYHTSGAVKIRLI
jgi:hypothetical protein